MSQSIKSDYLLSFQAIGRGINLRESDNAIVVDAGWDVESSVNGAVLITVGKPLKNVKLVGEFRGFSETRWETMTKLASKPESPTYKVQRYGKVFQQIVEIIYDSKHPLAPAPTGGAISLPFKFKLPKKNMPPSFECNGGAIQYYIKFSMLFQEGMKLLRTNYEFEVPVQVYMPESAKLKMLKSPSQFNHEVAATDEKCGYTLEIPKRVVTVGETLEVNLTITKTPGDAKLRMVYATIRPIVSCQNQDQVAAQVVFPRPLSEMTQMFPLVRVDGIDVVGRKLFLLIDPDLAQCSFESNIISAKTVFRLQIVLDNSETPNISLEIPIVVIPSPGGGSGGVPDSNGSISQSSASIYSSEESRLRSAESNSFLNVLNQPPMTPPMTPQTQAQLRRGDTAGSITSRTSGGSSLTSPSSFVRLPDPRMNYQNTPPTQVPYDAPNLGRHESMNSFASSRYDGSTHRQEPLGSGYNIQQLQQQQQQQMYGQPQQNHRQQQQDAFNQMAQQQQMYRSESMGQGSLRQAPQQQYAPNPYIVPAPISRQASHTGVVQHQPQQPFAQSHPTPQQTPTPVPQQLSQAQAPVRNINSIQNDLSTFLSELEVNDPMPAAPAYTPMDDKLQRQLEWERTSASPHPGGRAEVVPSPTPQQHQSPLPPIPVAASPVPTLPATPGSGQIAEQQQQQQGLDYQALSTPPQPRDWDSNSARYTNRSGEAPANAGDGRSIMSAGLSVAEGWSVDAVAEWLAKVGASPEIVKNFVEQEIDGAVLVSLTPDDLKNELGVASLGLRRKIAMAIDKLRSS